MTKSKRYPNLHRLNWTPNWVFRKYSAEKRKEFVKSTGFPGEDRYAARAYKEGVELFNAWLGSYLPSGRQLKVKDLARAVVAAKKTKRWNTYRSTKSQMENHVIPAFGHLTPDRINPGMWKRYDELERARGKRTKLFNTRKALLECLHRAKDDGLINDVPRLKNYDAAPAAPKYIPAQVYLRILRRLPPKIRLLAFVLYHQGARPSEVLQYEWGMIDFADGPTGSISIPGHITKTGRARKIPLNSLVSRRLSRLELKTLGLVVFASRDSADRPLSAYNAVWDRAMTALGLDFTIYNLRDTFITNALKRGLSSTFVGKYIDTSSVMIESKYAVGEDDVMRKVAG